jgi:hypothetical protein
MAKFSVRLGLIVSLSAVGLIIAGAAMAAPPRGGNAGGRGGVPHPAPAAHFSAPAAHFSRPSFSGGHPAFSGGHPTFRTNTGRSFSHSNFHGNIAHTYSRPTFRGTTSHSTSYSAAHPTFRGNIAHPIAGHNELLETHRNMTINKNMTLNRVTTQNSRAIRSALNSHTVRDALRNPAALHNPNTRSLITARTAAAGWHHGEHNFEHGWWRHRHGGFGWVGPIFWPFAYYDFYDYALWGWYDYSFWDYGYDDIYAGLFPPYDYDDLAGYFPQEASLNPPRGHRGGPPSAPSTVTQLCGENGRDIAGLPIDQTRQTLQLNDQQRAALDDLANASAKAAQIITAACPTDISLTAPGRLTVMQQRVEAMAQAVHIVQPALEDFYRLLSDEQKAKLTALGANQNRNNETTGSLAQTCAAAPAGVTDWPASDIDQAVHPTDAQRTRLAALKEAGGRAADLLKASCPSEEPLTPPARLEAVAKRLDAMAEAVKLVRAELNGFYDALSDEQKAQFDAIGPQRAARG